MNKFVMSFNRLLEPKKQIPVSRQRFQIRH